MDDTLADLPRAFAGKTVLVLGDVMLDRFIYGAVDRISPEAPVPVIAVEKETAMLAEEYGFPEGTATGAVSREELEELGPVLK